MLAALLLLIALPWMAAETGFTSPSDVFMGEEVPAVRDEGSPPCTSASTTAWAASCSSLIALLLSRVPAGRGLRAVPVSACSSTGIANAVAGRLERAALEARLGRMARAGVLRPELTLGWLGILLAAAAVYWLWFRPPREE